MATGTFVQRLASIDELARRVAPGGGAGFHEQQVPQRYTPSIEHPNGVLQQVLLQAASAGPLRTVLEVGTGRFGVRHQALRAVAERVVSVEADADRLRRAVAGVAGEPAGSVFVPGRGSDPAVVAELRRVANGCDLLLLDGSEQYAGMAADWRALAGLVRPGGLVAIVDRCQAWPESPRGDDVDRFVFDVGERYLHPRGRRWRRYGRGHGIVTYVRTATDDEANARWPEPAPSAAPAWEAMPVAGFHVGAEDGHWFAVRGEAPTLGLRAIARHDHELAFTAESRDALLGLLARWQQVDAVATAGLAAMANGDPTAFAAAATAARALPDARDWLTVALQRTPRSVVLLRVAGTLSLLLGDRTAGTALLRTAVDLDFADVQALQALVFAEATLGGDAAAARELLVTMRRRVADRERTRICLQELRGHALWTQPRLLHGHQSLTWIGTGGEAGLRGGARLGMRGRWLPNDGAPQTAAADPASVLADVVVGDGAPCTLYRDPRDGAVAQRPWAPGYAREQRCTQTELGRVPTVTLDELLRSGRLQPADLDVLVIDVQGPLLPILHGAVEALKPVRSLCLRVQHQAVFAGSVPHPEILGWLQTQGLHLLGCEPCTDPTSAFALLQRPRA